MKENKFIITFNSGPKVEIKGEMDKKYLVEFIDSSTNKIIHSDTINNNMWTACSKKYFINWVIKINGEIIQSFNLNNKIVRISFDSKSVGDTIAWFPYVEEFRKKWGCKIICSTFHNKWFEKNYSQIEFVNPGENIGEAYVSYNIGWFYKDGKWDNELLKNDFRPQPLAKTATDILGLKYSEIKPNINNDNGLLKDNIEKYVTLSIQSTAQSKYWNHPTGWQQVVDFINSKGYKVVLVDQFKEYGVAPFINYSPKNIIDKSSCSLNEVISIISKSEFHLGISSGLSWLAWAVNTPVVLVSSFTKPYCEFTTNCIRIYNDTPLSGYFNTHKLDPSDWNWYPFRDLESMEDWYEVENITPEQVINEIKKLL